jgi:hypothetical protein
MALTRVLSRATRERSTRSCFILLGTHTFAKSDHTPSFHALATAFGGARPKDRRSLLHSGCTSVEDIPCHTMKRSWYSIGEHREECSARPRSDGHTRFPLLEEAVDRHYFTS